MAVRFVAVGELLVDVVAAGAGHDARIRIRPAGSGFNAAVAAREAGADATVIGTVGDDPAGQMILAELNARGVHAEVTVERRIDGDVPARRRRDSSRPGRRPPARPPGADPADAVLVSGYVEAAADALARADAAWIALDAARLASLPPGGNAVIANEETARRLTGLGPEEAARRLAGARRLACVTSGPVARSPFWTATRSTRVPRPRPATAPVPATPSLRPCSSRWHRATSCRPRSLAPLGPL